MTIFLEKLEVMLPIIISIGAFFLAIILTTIALRFIIDRNVQWAIHHGALENLDFKIKKLEVARIGRYHALLLGLGFVFTLAIINVFIEWKTYDEKEVISLAKVNADFEEIYEIPPTTQPPPPKPVLQQPEIVAVPDEEEIEQEIEINMDVEVTSETKIVDVEKGPVIEDFVEEEEIEEIFLIVEDEPKPIGGLQAFYTFLAENIQYPEQARRIGTSGRVFVEFVVDKDGNLTDPRIVKGIGSGCDEEAIRVIKMAPAWKPGKQRGRPVKVKMTVPVFFKLE